MLRARILSYRVLLIAKKIYFRFGFNTMARKKAVTHEQGRMPLFAKDLHCLTKCWKQWRFIYLTSGLSMIQIIMLICYPLTRASVEVFVYNASNNDR